MVTIDTIWSVRVAKGDSSQQKGLMSGFLFTLLSGWTWFAARLEKSRSRKVLAELSDEQLEDIGITRQEARRESVRPFWN